MEYKLRDKVRIKSLDWYNQNKDQYGRVACGYHVFTEEMSKFCGCTMIVCNRTNLGVMTMGGSANYWTDEMIEGIAYSDKPKMVKLDDVCKWIEDNIFYFPWYDFDKPLSVKDITNELRKAMKK